MATRKRAPVWRYMGIAVIFCLVCVIYLGRLFYIQISGRVGDHETGTTERTVTIQAVRGEICDRNGTVLVANHNTHDLTLPYDRFSKLSVFDANETCLKLWDAMRQTGETDRHEERFFPFEGAYPYYSFSAEARDGDSVVFYRLQRVLGDVGLEDDASIGEIVDYYTKAHALLAVDSNGRRLYDDDEVDRLLRFCYDMDAVRFAAAGEYTVAKDVSLELMTYVKESALSAVSFKVNATREYRYPGYASHILGTVGPIYSEEWEYYSEQGYQMNAIVGKSGCEAAFESYLRGVDGKMKIVEDAAGNVISTTILSEPIAGNDVHLTIDINLQVAAENALRANVERVGGDCNAGAAVAMDPKDFSVLAIASYPTYDLSTYQLLYNQLAEDEAKPLLNRAINGVYAPGSTYKLGVAAAALTNLDGSLTDAVTCNGVYNRYHRPGCSTSDLHSSKNVDLIEAIADSCNCYFYEMGYLLGINNMNAYMESLGFGQSTGLELGGATGSVAGPEYRQQIHHPYPWQEGDVLSAAIGQSDNTATPIQLTAYLSTLLGSGTRYAAHLLHSVYAFGGDEPLYEYTPSVLSSVELSDADRADILEGMRQATSGNGAVRESMRRLPVTVGCKTGTAQVGGDSYNALFVCAAPYDSPDVVISVVLENGQSGGNASYTAGKILEAYYGVKTDAVPVG
ncbi:MAG: hypothetical protein IKJ35_01000 [Clostridia bacterium]|nr:hypothetical protein [Clostridia bacterium]